mmetsp:Transcript_77586/g.219375  ORF Transcript_77586/g.219375 Transcript_77586/m.219375 type:complete len:258 (+) Transcript_77586:771-1544(+)
MPTGAPSMGPPRGTAGARRTRRATRVQVGPRQPPRRAGQGPSTAMTPRRTTTSTTSARSGACGPSSTPCRPERWRSPWTCRSRRWRRTSTSTATSCTLASRTRPTPTAWTSSTSARSWRTTWTPWTSSTSASSGRTTPGRCARPRGRCTAAARTPPPRRPPHPTMPARRPGTPARVDRRGASPPSRSRWRPCRRCRPSQQLAAPRMGRSGPLARATPGRGGAATSSRSWSRRRWCSTGGGSPSSSRPPSSTRRGPWT